MNNIINIDGKEYKEDDLSEVQIKLLNKIHKWQNECNNLSDSLECANKLKEAYIKELQYSLSNKKSKVG